MTIHGVYHHTAESASVYLGVMLEASIALAEYRRYRRELPRNRRQAYSFVRASLLALDERNPNSEQKLVALNALAEEL